MTGLAAFAIVILFVSLGGNIYGKAGGEVNWVWWSVFGLIGGLYITIGIMFEYLVGTIVQQQKKPSFLEFLKAVRQASESSDQISIRKVNKIKKKKEDDKGKTNK
jgi:hypothetical protein